MIEQLPAHPLPQWLADLNQDNIRETFSLRNVLTGSLYYPGSELDLTPIQLLSGNVQSFVYADCGVTGQQLTRWMNSTLETDKADYRLIAATSLDDSDLSPSFCWDPENRRIGHYSSVAVEFVQRFRDLAGSPMFDENVFEDHDSARRVADTELSHYFRLIEKSRHEFSSALEFLKDRQDYLRLKAHALASQFEPYPALPPHARFMVFEKTESSRPEAPLRICMLFLCEEASLAYEMLYARHAIAPSVLFIKNCKNAHGDNRPWSPGEPRHSPLYNSVMQAPVHPDYLAYKMYNDDPDWEGWEPFASVPLPENYRGDSPLRLLRRLAESSEPFPCSRWKRVGIGA
jgi:hypothetical protein